MAVLQSEARSIFPSLTSPFLYLPKFYVHAYYFYNKNIDLLEGETWDLGSWEESHMLLIVVNSVNSAVWKILSKGLLSGSRVYLLSRMFSEL